MTTDTATIDCPVKCEGCSVVVPMAGALHTEDPVYLCGKCAAGAVESQMRAERDAAIAARDEAVRERDIYERGFAVASQNKVDLAAARDAAERARDEVGIQLAAAESHMAKMRGAIEAMRTLRHEGVMPDRVARAMDAIFSALDAVPGDALGPVGTVGGVPVYVDPALPDGYVRRGPSPRETQGDLKRACDKLTAALDDAGISSAGGAVIEVRDALLDHLKALGFDALAPKMTAALEASGIDAASVKGVE